MKNYKEVINDYDLTINEANEIIMTRIYNLEEHAYQAIEVMNSISKTMISICSYPKYNKEYDKEEYITDFFFSINNMSNNDIIKNIEIMIANNYRD
jgi:hypothetical protein